MDIIDILESSQFFGGLETAQVQKVSDFCCVGSYKEGTIIFSEGDKADELYVLNEGKVILEMVIRPVTQRPPIPIEVEIVEKGESFGWSALVWPYEYTLSARCASFCTVLSIKGDILRRMMDADMRLGYELTKGLSRIIALRLHDTRLRLISGIVPFLIGRELETDKK